MKAMPINTIGGSGGVLRFDRKLLRDRFNRLPFEFDHGLAGHPLFDKDRLLELARFLPNGDVWFNDGNIDVNDKWSKIGRSAGTIENAIGNIEESGSWIILKKVNQDPQYRMLMEEAMTNLEDRLDRRVRPSLDQLDAYIFMASPGGVTPLHIDAECTFLCQISGEKRVNVFDPTDREVLPHEEIERFHLGQLESATYRPEFKSRAHNFTIRSGTGVHLPIIAPHWVENYKNVSCSFSISFVDHADRKRGRVYVANHYLRRFFNADASDPGSNELWDTTREVGTKIIRKINKFRRARFVA